MSCYFIDVGKLTVAGSVLEDVPAAAKSGDDDVEDDDDVGAGSHSGDSVAAPRPCLVTSLFLSFSRITCSCALNILVDCFSRKSCECSASISLSAEEILAS